MIQMKRKKERLIKIEGNTVRVDKLVEELIKSKKDVLAALAHR